MPKPKSKPMPNAFVSARVIRTIPTTGLTAGTKVYVRKSRQGGWRILGMTEQVVVGDSGITQYVRSERVDHLPVMAGGSDADALDAHVLNLYRGTVNTQTIARLFQ